MAFMAVGQVLILNQGLQQELLDVQQRELRRELELAPLILTTLQTEDPDSASRALAFHMGYPVTLLDEEGRVVGASSDLPFQLRGMVVSPESGELEAARRGDVGFSQRRGSGEVEIRLFVATAARLGGEDYLLQVAVPIDEIQRTVRTRILQTLGLLLPAFLLAVALTIWVGRALTRPIQTVGRRARGLSAGNFSRRVPTTIGVEELRDLAGTFNRMTEELAARFRSMEGERNEMQTLIDCMGEGVIALTEDARVLTANQAAIDLLDFPDPVNFAPVGALVRQPSLRNLLEMAVVKPFPSREVSLGERSLIVSSRALEGGGAVVTFVDVTETRRVEMVRRDFVANASHELKTPLTAMRGFAETLLEDDLPEDLRRDWLSSIRANTIRLQRLVDDLLDLSRLESGGWMAKVEVVEVRPLVEDILAETEPLAQEKELSTKVKGDGLVLADAQGLEQVVKNLVDNAIRYTPSGGKIRVTIQEEEESVRITVEDNGPGIPTAALSRIFERFYRVDPARSRAEGGTGLGLAIVRHLVHAMDGEVWAESELGQGTRVMVVLPAPQESELEEMEEDYDDELEGTEDVLEGVDEPDGSGPSRGMALSLLLAFMVAGCGSGGDTELRGHVTIDGSSTVYPIAEAVSEEFQLETPRVLVALGRSGTGGGFERFCRGEADIAAASRKITQGEDIRCASQGVQYLEIPVALDGVSVVVNPGNTFLQCLTVRELREVWRAGSPIRTWRDLRPEFPPGELSLYGPGTDSGTYDTFTEAVIGEAGASRTDFQASEDDNVLVQGVTGDRFALGFLGYAYYAENRERLKVVAVDGGSGCVAPGPETIQDGAYAPLSRTLYVYVNVPALGRPGMAAFMEYFMEHAGELIPPTGFIPLSEDAYRENLARVRELGPAPERLSAAGTGGASTHE